MDRFGPTFSWCGMEPARILRTPSSTLGLSTMSGHVRMIYFIAIVLPPELCVVLTKYLPKIKVRREKNLLGSSTTGETTEEVEEVVCSAASL